MSGVLEAVGSSLTQTRARRTSSSEYNLSSVSHFLAVYFLTTANGTAVMNSRFFTGGASPTTCKELATYLPPRNCGFQQRRRYPLANINRQLQPPLQNVPSSLFL